MKKKPLMLTENERTLLEEFRRIKSSHMKFVAYVIITTISAGPLTEIADRKKNLRQVYPEFR